MKVFSEKCTIDHLSPLYNLPVVLDVLRLDEVHPLVSGNKWFKLKKYLVEAEAHKKTTLLTFGGAYSNHIIATAAAAKMKGFKSIGIIRGEKPTTLSHTLLSAVNDGMHLYFILRDAYKQKIIPKEVFEDHPAEKIYLIPEGGYGINGMQGAMDIAVENDISGYNYILLAVGTGTTLAGLANSISAHEKIIGISALKNNPSLQNEIEHLLPKEKHSNFELLHDYHFGGYAKHTRELIDFMNEFYSTTNIPTDFVYTAKAFYAAFDLLKKQFFTNGDKILLIHTGGLQGNESLKKGTLIFE